MRRQSKADVREEKDGKHARIAFRIDKNAADGDPGGAESSAEHTEAEEVPHGPAEDTPKEPTQEPQRVGEATDDASPAVAFPGWCPDFISASRAPG